LGRGRRVVAEIAMHRSECRSSSLLTTLVFPEPDVPEITIIIACC
jgi:hypothetical protein